MVVLGLPSWVILVLWSQMPVVCCSLAAFENSYGITSKRGCYSHNLQPTAERLQSFIYLVHLSTYVGHVECKVAANVRQEC